MTVVNLVNQTPLNIATHEPKSLKEGPAGGDDAQILIENYEWIAHGIDDGLRERKSGLDIDEWRGLRGQAK